MLNQLISIRVDRRSQRREFLQDPWQETGGCAKITVIEGLFLLTAWVFFVPINELSTGFCFIDSGHEATGCGEVGWLFINLRR